jgi:hypothetical protein
MGKKTSQRRQDDGRLSLLPILTGRKVGPSRFPCDWRRQMANRSRLASGSVGQLTLRRRSSSIACFRVPSGHLGLACTRFRRHRVRCFYGTGVTAYKLRMRLLKVSCPRILSATNDPKHLLKKEIIGDVHYATVLFAQYCKHEIVLRANTRRMKCPKINRHRLGVSEQEWRTGYKQ